VNITGLRVVLGLNLLTMIPLYAVSFLGNPPQGSVTAPGGMLFACTWCSCFVIIAMVNFVAIRMSTVFQDSGPKILLQVNCFFTLFFWVFPGFVGMKPDWQHQAQNIWSIGNGCLFFLTSLDTPLRGLARLLLPR
jgi:hypothetical protein